MALLLKVFISPSCLNSKVVLVLLPAKRLILHQYFWASILVGKVGHALQVQTSGMSMLTPQSLPVLSAKSGPQAAATTVGTLPSQGGRAMPSAWALPGWVPAVSETPGPLCDHLALEGV